MRKLIATLLLSMFVSTSWANKDTIKIMVPVPVGGTWDAVARSLAKHMEDHTSDTVLVENRPGAMSQIGIRNFVSTSTRENSILVSMAEVFAVDFEGSDQVLPIAYIGSIPESIVVRSTSKLIQVKDLAVTKDRVTIACIGYGGLTGYLTSAAKNANLECVPYKGALQAINDVMGGHVDVASSGLANAKALRDSSRIKILGYTGHKRSHLAPDVPTLLEQGIDLPSSLKFWVFVHKDTPPKKIAELQKIILSAVAGSKFKSATYDLGLDIEPYSGSAADYFYRHVKLVQDFYKK